MALVTVIIPAFQAERTLGRAVRSIVLQTFDDWELVVVNDASTDGTERVANEEALKDRRIRAIHLERNGGAAAAMNLAWKQSRARFVAILDADDFAEAGRLNAQAAYLNANPAVTVLGSAARFFDREERFMRTVYPAETHERMARERWYRCPFVHPSVMMRREFLEATGGYAEDLRLGEDFDLWMRGFLHPEFRYANLSEPLVRYTARRVQRWKMICASAAVRRRAGLREGRRLRGWWAGLRILAEGAVEQTRIFALRDRLIEAVYPRFPGNQAAP